MKDGLENIPYSLHTLDNGLTVLMKEDHSAPAISHWIFYRVGSRNEVPGKTGISHFVEHMQFKGTSRFTGQEFSQVIARNGGYLTGFTYFDYTAFFETMPANRIGAAIEMEADRMTNSLFDPNEVDLERNVILSEKEGDENDSSFQLSESMRKAVLSNHPYAGNILGDIEDLHQMTRDDLYDHYRTWYAPNNAVVTVAGDFNKDEMLRLIETAYGSIPYHLVPRTEIAPARPVQKTIKIEEQGTFSATDLQIEWVVPGAKDPSTPALILLNIILNGAKTSNALDSISLPNRTSRLYRKLVSTGKTSFIRGNYIQMLDPFILDLTTNFSFEIEPEEVYEAIFEEIEDIARTGVRPEEIKKAQKQAKALYAYSAEDITNQAYWLGHGSMIADPAWYAEYLQRLDKVSAEDISRAAGTILRRDNCVIGIRRAKNDSGIENSGDSEQTKE